jgi:hypothetical protein
VLVNQAGQRDKDAKRNMKKEKDKRQKQAVRDARQTALGSASQGMSGSGRLSLTPSEVAYMWSEMQAEQNVLMCLENSDWHLVYTASQHSCSLCKGPHRESFCPAARALVQKFDAATADMPSGSVCNLNRLLYLYKQHYSTAFKPIDAGFADMSRVVKALSPFAVPTVNISGTTQFVIRGKVWSTAGGADTWNLDLCTSPELVSPIASKALSSTDQFATPDTIPRETVSDHFGTDQCSTSKSLEDIFKTTIVTTGQHSRATTLGLPYRRYHTKSLSLFLHSIHDDMALLTRF